ncbi:MAG: DUF262 domain-containing protein, partial [Bacteroidetes bacterium]|nr:DUF262 domain-containing protein [Bacteroidota bacterium]
MKISQIIVKIDENHLFVPAFQREYVWKKADAKKLINSLIKDYPTGTMLTWETNTPPELKGDYEYKSSRGAVKLILDGQQRITTLYMLMTGKIPPYYQEKEILDDIRGLYVNVQDGALEYYRKRVMQNDPRWVDITKIFQKEIRRRDIIEKLEHKRGEQLPRILENEIEDIIDSILKIEDREFLEQTIPVEATIREAIDIFYIVNSSGVNLTEAELALAQISGYWPQAREKFKGKLYRLSEKGWVFKLDFIVYVLLGIIHGMGSNMRKLHGEENKDEIKRVWEILDDRVLDYALNLLQSKVFVDHSSEINSVYALVPIITYIYQQPDHKLNGEQISKVKKWFYYSQIRTRYISQLPQKLDKDLKIVASLESPFDELLKLIGEDRPLEVKPHEFNGRGIQSPYFNLMKWVFKSQDAICLGTGLSIRKNMGKKYALENDHIFAYSTLRDSDHFNMENKIDYSLAQEFTGRMILTMSANRTKSNKLAEVYLKEAKERFPGALRLQCIPENEELWKVENYKEFLKARRELLAHRFNEFLNSISETDYDIESQIDISDLIATAEGPSLEFKATLRYCLAQQKVDRRLEDVILKTVAAFSNQDGGTLIIGVTDDKHVLGLHNDYNTLRDGSRDSFELHLRNLLGKAFGKGYVATNIGITFPLVDDEEICLVDIKSGQEPLFT